MFYRKLFYQALFVALLSVFAVDPIRAQEVDDVIRTESSLVQLNIGVVDKQGRPITSLTQKDFVVYEDGVKQSIQHFEPVDAPFSLVLMLDMSGSTVNFRQQLKLASQRFLDALAPEDRVAVIQFNKEVKSLTGFTVDRMKTAYASAEVCAQRTGEGRQATQSHRRVNRWPRHTSPQLRSRDAVESANRSGSAGDDQSAIERGFE
jgi:VWFA-related protein